MLPGAVTELVTTARVRREDLPAVLAPRTSLIAEAGDGTTFTAVVGPVHHYRRTVEVVEQDDREVEVRQRVEYDLAIPIFGWLFALPYRRALGHVGAGNRRHWWAPPEPIDPSAAAMLAALCALTGVAVYPGSLLTQAIEFVREELGFTKQAQSVALAALRADIVVAFGLVVIADRKGRRITTLWAIGLGAASAALGALAPNLAILTATQVVARGCLTGAAILMSIMAAEEMPAGCRAYAVSLLTVSGALGIGLALALFPLADTGTRGWRIPFAVAALLVPLVVVLGRRLPESKRFRAPHVEATVAGHGRRLWLLGISAVLFAVFLAPASQYQNVFLRRERGFSASRIALFTVATNVWGGIGIVVGGRMADIKGRRLVAAVGIVGGVGATVLMFFAAGWTVWAWSVVGAIVGAATIPALGVYGPELFPTSLRGRANGIISALGRIGSVAGLLFVAVVVGTREHLAPILALLALGPALLAVLVLVAYPETAHLELEEINPEDAPPVASEP
jgi:MFS family permease